VADLIIAVLFLTVKEYLGKYSKKLSPQQTYQLVEKKMTSLPLFLRSILEQLRIFGNFEELSKYIDYFLECSDISSLFEKILTRWEADYNTSTYPASFFHLSRRLLTFFLTTQPRTDRWCKTCAHTSS
jgi:hypothetical protein